MKKSLLLVGVTSFAVSAIATCAHAGGNIVKVGSPNYGIGTNGIQGQGLIPEFLVTLMSDASPFGNLKFDGPNGSLANSVTPVGALIARNAGTVGINSEAADSAVGR